MEIAPSSTSLFSSGSDQRIPSQNLDQDDFLQIMVSQLKAQDPFNSVDSNQFMEQFMGMANFSVIQELGAKFELLQDQQLQTVAFTLVGANVTVDGESGLIQGDVEQARVGEDKVFVTVNGDEYGLEQVVSVQQGVSS